MENNEWIATRYTSGPWGWESIDGEYCDMQLVSLAEKNDYLRIVLQKYSCLPIGSQYENLCLIASAPELFEALQDLVKAIELQPQAGITTAKARAVLAKAIGGQMKTSDKLLDIRNFVSSDYTPSPISAASIYGYWSLMDMLHERMEEYTTMEKWLIHAGVPEDEITPERAKAHTLRWIDQLIEEFTEKED